MSDTTMTMVNPEVPIGWGTYWAGGGGLEGMEYPPPSKMGSLGVLPQDIFQNGMI